MKSGLFSWTTEVCLDLFYLRSLRSFAGCCLPLLPGQQTQHFEMRRAGFARNAFALQDFKPGLARETGQVFAFEAEVLVIERRHRRAMRVLRQGRRQQPPTRLQYARR